MNFELKTNAFLRYLIDKATPARIYLAERSIELFFWLVCIACAIAAAVALLNGWYWLSALCLIIALCLYSSECKIEVEHKKPTNKDLFADDSKG